MVLKYPPTKLLQLTGGNPKSTPENQCLASIQKPKSVVKLETHKLSLTKLASFQGLWATSWINKASMHRKARYLTLPFTNQSQMEVDGKFSCWKLMIANQPMLVWKNGGCFFSYFTKKNRGFVCEDTQNIFPKRFERKIPVFKGNSHHLQKMEFIMSRGWRSPPATSCSYTLRNLT